MIPPLDMFPAIELQVIGRQKVVLPRDAAANLTMLDVYSGVHCSYCERHLKDLVVNLEAFVAEGVFVIAASNDTQEQAERAAVEWHLANLPVAHDLPLQTAIQLGLYVSNAGASKGRKRSCEPGIFFIDAKGMCRGSVISTIPYARPSARELIRAAIEIQKSNLSETDTRHTNHSPVRIGFE